MQTQQGRNRCRWRRPPYRCWFSLRWIARCALARQLWGHCWVRSAANDKIDERRRNHVGRGCGLLGVAWGCCGSSEHKCIIWCTCLHLHACHADCHWQGQPDWGAVPHGNWGGESAPQDLWCHSAHMAGRAKVADLYIASCMCCCCIGIYLLYNQSCTPVQALARQHAECTRLPWRLFCFSNPCMYQLAAHLDQHRLQDAGSLWSCELLGRDLEPSQRFRRRCTRQQPRHRGGGSGGCKSKSALRSTQAASNGR